MIETYEQINTDEVKIIRTTEEVVNVKELAAEILDLETQITNIKTLEYPKGVGEALKEAVDMYNERKNVESGYLSMQIADKQIILDTIKNG